MRGRLAVLTALSRQKYLRQSCLADVGDLLGRKISADGHEGRFAYSIDNVLTKWRRSLCKVHVPVSKSGDRNLRWISSAWALPRVGCDPQGRQGSSGSYFSPYAHGFDRLRRRRSVFLNSYKEFSTLRRPPRSRGKTLHLSAGYRFSIFLFHDVTAFQPRER